MKLFHLMLLFDGLLGIFCFIDPFSLSIGLGIAGALWMMKTNDKNGVRSNVVYRKIENVVMKGCQMIGYCEGCEDSWIPFNIQDLEADFKKQVFGQHIAVEEVKKTLKYHLQKKHSPDKALVLSFHGPPGVGKSMISKLVIKNMFYRGGKTNYAHFYRGSIDFPIKNEVFKYQEKLKREIIEKVEQCNRAVFVFDEVDKMPAQVLDVLWQFVDKYAVYNNVDYRNIIIIFLSNLGSQNITSKSIELWQDGKLREDYKLEDFEGIIRNAIFNSSGGLQKSRLISKNIIDRYIPFIPLGMAEVRQCLVEEMKKVGQVMSEELFEQVLDMLSFEPDGYEIYASSGCKLIGEKASVLIEREMERLSYNVKT